MHGANHCPQRGGRAGGRGRLPESLPRALAAGCSQPPCRHKGAQVINWSKGAKLLKRYSAKPCSGAAACVRLLLQHTCFHLFIYFGWLPQIRVHRSDISCLPPRRGSPQLAGALFQADSDRIPCVLGQRWEAAVRRLRRVTSPPLIPLRCLLQPPHPTGRHTDFSRGHSECGQNALHPPPFQSLVPPSPALARRVTISTASGQPWHGSLRAALSRRTNIPATLHSSCALAGTAVLRVGAVLRSCRALAEAPPVSAGSQVPQPQLGAGGTQTLLAHRVFSDQF